MPGLADEELLAREIPDLDLFYPWDLPVERAIELAQACEGAAFAVDKRITNSEGATVSLQQSQFAYGNSLGFLGGYPSSRHWISCAVIAGKGDAMQRDDWYASARDPAELDAPETIGRIAGTRAIQRLGAKKIATMQVPVLFEAPAAATLLGHFVGAVSGGSLYRKSSFLLDSLGKPVFSPLVEISDDPHIPKGLASSPFDEEGVATRRRNVVERGVVQGYFLSSYSARKLGMKSTGNAGGNHNLLLRDTGLDLPQLLQADGARAAGNRTDGAGHQYGDRRLFARRRRILGRKWRHRLSGAGNHHRRQPEGHVPQHRCGRQRHRQARLQAMRIGADRAHDRRRRLSAPREWRFVRERA